MEFLVAFISALVTSLALPLFFRPSNKIIQADEAGWTKLATPLACIVIIVITVPMMLVAAGVSALVPFLGMSILEAGFISLLCAGFVCAWAMSVYALLLTKIKFNDQGIAYQGITKTLFVEWKNVRSISKNHFLSEHAKTEKGNLLVWKQRTGFIQLLDEAGKHNIRVDPNVLS